MKKIIYTIVLSILVLYILFFPKSAIDAASFGLVLWYTRMLPTLLPFAILSYIFVASGILNTMTDSLHKLLKLIFPISAAGVYPLIAGFLFGFPLGSRITAQMLEQGKMTPEEGNRLFAICNNISPVFITGFILTTSFQRPDLKALTLLILYLPPLIYYMAEGWYSHTRKKGLPPISETVPASGSMTKKAASRSQINFKIIDAGIMSGFETLAKLGGYIMLFAIFAQMTTYIPLHNDLLQCFLVGITEITNGIACISASALPFRTKYLLMILCTAFGGLCGIAQTASMVKEAGFSMGNYVKTKLICSLASAILAFFSIHLLF